MVIAQDTHAPVFGGIGSKNGIGGISDQATMQPENRIFVGSNMQVSRAIVNAFFQGLIQVEFRHYSFTHDEVIPVSAGC
jgi:hypothetical protein